MIFWLLALIILLPACFVVAYAVNRKASSDPQNSIEARIARNVSLYRQKLAELEQQQQEGLLDAQHLEQLTVDLSRQLLNDVEGLQVSIDKSSGKRWYVLFGLLPVMAMLLYLVIGNYPDWKISQELQALSEVSNQAEFTEKLEDIHQNILARLEDKPDHIEYRIMLARYAMSQQDFNEAVVHYGILAELLPNDADVLGYYAQAVYLANGRVVDNEVKRYIDKALQLNPHQSTVLGLQGIDAFEKGDIAGAVDAWEKLLKTLEPGSEQARIIQSGLQQARAQLAQEAGEQLPGEVVIAKPSITVTVSIDNAVPELDGSLPVFVYAKAASGPPMPLAVQKTKLKDLPGTFTLDDSMAMMPTMKLSDYDTVIVGARISLTGKPVAQEGDWQGESQPINWKESPELKLGIDTQIKN